MKKIISAILATTMLMSMSVGAWGNAKKTEDLNDLTQMTESRSKKINWYKLAWNIAKYACEKSYTREPETYSDENGESCTSGTLKFNSKKDDIGGSVSHLITISETDNGIRTNMNGSALDFFSKANITMYGPDRKEVKEKTVKSGQHCDYEITDESQLGEYNITYHDEDTKKWNCVLIRTNYSLESKSSSNPDLLFEDSNVYLKPSVPTSQRACLKSFKNSSSLTMKELYTQFVDVNTDYFVNNLRDYAIGDTIILQDNIKDISYNNKKNYTEITFEGDGEDIEWRFKDNITNQYKKGDSISLSFDVVEETVIDGIHLETLNYLKDAAKSINTNHYPCLNTYITK